jgi:hypothetical protein
MRIGQTITAVDLAAGLEGENLSELGPNPPYPTKNKH